MFKTINNELCKSIYNICFEDSPCRCFNAVDVQLPCQQPEFLKIFKSSTSPKTVFKTIYYLFSDEVEADFFADNFNNIIHCFDEVSEYLEWNQNEIYSEKIGIIKSAIKDNPEWIPNFVTSYDYDLVPHPDDEQESEYFYSDSVRGTCTINLTEYAKSHSELYMFQLEILSAFIGKLGATQETDTIIETILDATKTLADNHAEDCISKLLTDDIYKNLWFDDNIKTKVSNLIQ